MSESKHTPGPWKVGYQSMDVWASDAKGPFKVCDIRGWGHFTGRGHGALGLDRDEAVAIQVANANLIAAAPDLKAFAESIAIYTVEGDEDRIWLRFGDAHIAVFSTDSDVGVTLLRLEAARRAAIAKATGGAQ